MIASDLDGHLRLPVSRILPPGPREWALARCVLSRDAVPAELLVLLEEAGAAGATSAELRCRRGTTGSGTTKALEALRHSGLVSRERYETRGHWGWRWRLTDAIP